MQREDGPGVQNARRPQGHARGAFDSQALHRRDASVRERPEGGPLGGGAAAGADERGRRIHAAPAPAAAGEAGAHLLLADQARPRLHHVRRVGRARPALHKEMQPVDGLQADCADRRLRADSAGELAMSIKPLVSVIMPTYNSSKHIRAAIDSVLSQTYTNWELCITDDCSNDGTTSILAQYSEMDSRIKYCVLSTNSGAAVARNKSLEMARGRYISYLDSDDVWDSTKIELQVAFMQANDAAFSCVSYRVIDESGTSLGKTVKMPDGLDYRGFLTNNLLQTVGIMVDAEITGRDCLVMPNLRRRQDAATWLQILKRGYTCHGIADVLCSYRRTPGSLSSNKLKAAWGVWSLYRDVEQLPLLFSCKCFIRYAFLAIWKRVYPDRNGKI